MPTIALAGGRKQRSLSQCQRPAGWRGRLVLWSMNRRHSRVTDWGLGQVAIRDGDTILDVGCGGGRTVAKLALAAPKGRVHGIDYSPESVAVARRTNRELVEQGLVVIQEASVLDLPFPNDHFDLVTAVETHFWWQDLGAGMKEVFRVLKPGGWLAIVAEFYKGGRHLKYADRLARFTTMAILDVGEHEALFTQAGFGDVRMIEDAARGWLCGVGTKPAGGRTGES
ncbi:MAG: class I SAM-dependent methyltransferase [Acidobacteriota bacterium]|nr:class I SAM-dependent methyltransferase [Acidobacteriota bacterium]